MSASMYPLGWKCTWQRHVVLVNSFMQSVAQVSFRVDEREIHLM